MAESPSCFPWQPRPMGCTDAVWRYDKNPVIQPQDHKSFLGVFNSAVVPYDNAFAGVFRVEKRTRFPKLHTGFSNDGIQWEINAEPFCFESDCCNRPENEYAYDPRVCKLGEEYLITWCAGHNGPTIGMVTHYPEKRVLREV